GSQTGESAIFHSAWSASVRGLRDMLDRDFRGRKEAARHMLLSDLDKIPDLPHDIGAGGRKEGRSLSTRTAFARTGCKKLGSLCFQPRPEGSVRHLSPPGRKPFEQECFEPRLVFLFLGITQQAAEIFADITVSLRLD